MTTLLRNNTYVIQFNVTNEDGTPRDLTDIDDGFYTLARDDAAETAYLQIAFSSPQFNIADPINGVVKIDLKASDTEGLPVRAGIYEELHLIDTSISEQRTVSTNLINVSDTIAKAV